ncbi:hypothetical protein Q7689_21520, partial [Nocardiopsis tropica]|nr:hypothetical protein [Nocardiopsis tropica]
DNGSLTVWVESVTASRVGEITRVDADTLIDSLCARALARLPVAFTPDTPKGTTPPWQQTSPSSTPTTSTARQPDSAGEAPSSRLRSLVAWLFGR